VRVEDQGISHFLFANGVQGLLATGPSMKLVGTQNRLTGTKGVIELGSGDGKGGHKMRIWREGASGWEPIAGGLHGDDAFIAAIADAVKCAQTGRTPLLDCHNALRATELIFATYESSRRRARVDLPLTIDDSPLLSMLKNREIGAP